ncbi:uncharacterized protein CPUR_05527 [Claviceps purpurea 20.1]|uniref:ATP-dependent DNA helicase n=1 Tax=Claviceps purpurea (strain 20.1) TaxID=1111077 RepID=M1WGC7_CLAP2|nr:uncharacterized protein CPUR_05527 [Claviceps purpurea 20.1]
MHEGEEVHEEVPQGLLRDDHHRSRRVPELPPPLRRPAHINVELCGSIRSVKYLFKYVTKGTDRTTLAVKDRRDEITRYVKARYCVYFNCNLSASQLEEKAENTRSTLMGFFKWNTDHPETNFLYSDMPDRCVWKVEPGNRYWQWRKRGSGAIGRMYHCSPVAGERFYLRLLLTVVRGPKSFEDLYYYENERFPTYHAACVARGLAVNDNEWFACFDTSIVACTESALRTMFLIGLREQMIANPLAIWDRSSLGLRPLPARGKLTLAQFGLPAPAWDWTATHVAWSAGSATEDLAPRAARLRQQLNQDQETAFNAVTEAVRDDPSTAHFYLQGPGGTGKTFLYETLACHYRSEGKTVICAASTGIAALLLPGGRTSHSHFMLPIDLNADSTCNITKQSKTGPPGPPERNL